MSHSVIVLVAGASLPILFALLSAKYNSIMASSPLAEVMPVISLPFADMSHSVIVLVAGDSLPILFALLSAKYTFPEETSNTISATPLPLVGMSHSVIVLVAGASLPILFALLSAKYNSIMASSEPPEVMSVILV